MSDLRPLRTLVDDWRERAKQAHEALYMDGDFGACADELQALLDAWEAGLAKLGEDYVQGVQIMRLRDVKQQILGARK